MHIEAVYTDGGLLSRNPSRLGGTWCWIGVTDDRLIIERSGIIRPEDVGTRHVTNNVSELWALCEALEYLGAAFGRWAGVIWTDSLVTLHRFQTRDDRLRKTLAPVLRERLVRARRALGACAINLLGGHPSRADLARGHLRDGAPVSKWNVYVDEVCQRLAHLSRPVAEGKG